MTPKRIGMFLDSDFPPDSRVENEAVCLTKAGYEVHLFSLNYKGKHYKEVYRGIHVWHFSASQLTYKSSAIVYPWPLFDWLVEKKVVQFIESVAPEILHVHDMVLARVVMKVNAALPIKRPLILDLHENRPHIMQYYGFVNQFPGKQLVSLRAWDKWQGKLMHMADKVILVTEEARTEAERSYHIPSSKTYAVPNYADPVTFQDYPIDLKIKERMANAFTILYLGDTGLRRGTDTAILAMPEVLKKIPNAQLVLVGKNKEDIHLEDLIRKLGIEEKVSLEGWKDVSLFASYLAGAAICISPLKRNLHHDTTYANKIFQYMAMGKAQVVSNCTAQQHVIENAGVGLVHEATDESDLAAKIIALHDDVILRTEMENNARNSILHHFNWENAGYQLLSVYEGL